MFTGIIEQLGTIRSVKVEGTNRIFQIETTFPESIQVDQSIAHDGVCLTVTDIFTQTPGEKVHYSVTAVQETLEKTALNQWEEGRVVNLERCLKMGARLDGHFVQGHVDAAGKVLFVEEREGSWMYEFGFPAPFAPLLVDKGSVCINGVSLTVVKAGMESFSVTIIPFTYEHTNFHQLAAGESVNLEFDILGKYLLRREAVQEWKTTA